MTGTIRITPKSDNEEAILIPISALSSTPDGKAFVWTIEGENKVMPRPIQAGETSGELVTVVDGLAVGDMIVVAGLQALQEGMIVKPVSKVGE